MDDSSFLAEAGVTPDPMDTRPILVVPYVWIGDFVRGHSTVRALTARWPNRPIDLLSSTLCAPLADYMPGVRQAIVWDLPRGKISIADQRGLAERLRRESYGTALIMPRTWKSALAPALAGIPERTGFVGEVRFGLLNDWRWGEKKLARMVDKNSMLALPAGTPAFQNWPVPQLVVPAAEVSDWRAAKGVGDNPAVALAPGAVGPSKRWTAYGEAAQRLAAQGFDIWVIGGPGEMDAAQAIARAGGPRVSDLTGTDLRSGVLALAAASAVISNDSGLLHVAAALGTPTIGIFGPTSPYHWAPLNGLAATIQTTTELSCQPCHKPVCKMIHHRCMRDIPANDVVAVARDILAHLPAR